MSSVDGNPLAQDSHPAGFRTTHWSVVLAANGESTPGAALALETLCAAYWYPLYSFLRRQGRSPHDAQDLTQSFFAHLLSKDRLRSVDPRKGRFRSFLLASMKNFLANEWDKAQALKRGGGITFVPVDEEAGEERFCREPADTASPDRAFEQSWATTLLESVLARLREEYTADGRPELFSALQGCLGGDRDGPSYAEIAASQGLSEGAVKMAVLRMRRRFGELLRAEIAHTVTRPEEVDEEIRSLFAAVSGA